MLVEKQRSFRRKRRNKQEHARLKRHPAINQPIDNPDGSSRRKTPQEIESSISEALKDANTPYNPNCSPELAQKIMDAASKVNLFTIIHHLTSETHLTNMLDNGLFGRKTLLQQYTPFKKAALKLIDLEIGGGDANVICFGPNAIDRTARQSDSIKITMNIDKLQNNPAIFYKQQDLGLAYDKIYRIDVGRVNLYFSHTRKSYYSKPGYITFQKFNTENGELYEYSQLPNYLFIAYDLPNIHKILTLNFFRFLDTLKDNDTHLNDGATAKSFYAELDKLPPKELVAKLQEIGQEMTSTSEFNFYGAYKIDFNAVQEIESKAITLVLPSFIHALQTGDIDKLRGTEKLIPNLFKSYRFLDYLLSSPHAQKYPEPILNELNRIKATCSIPKYLTKHTSELETKADSYSTTKNLDSISPSLTPKKSS